MNRDFKGIWIPREIWLNKKLSIQAKALWSEIWSLHNRDSGGCFASNEYLCEFMNVKLSRLKEIMKELRDAELIVEVSFDGRHRVIRANLPEVEYGGQQPAGIPASSQPVFRPSDSRNSGRPSYILDTRVEISRENTSLKVPEEPSADADMFAVANDIILDNPPIQASLSEKPTKEKSQSDFSPQVKQVAQKMSSILKEANPDWIIPKNPISMMSQVKLLIEKDNRTPERILEVFRWTAADHFWMKNLSKPNPAKYLRDHFAQLAACADAKPPKKERRFAASSNDKIALEGMKNMETI